MPYAVIPMPYAVIPAQAGIQCVWRCPGTHGFPPDLERRASAYQHIATTRKPQPL
jgi:hypothetical protein